MCLSFISIESDYLYEYNISFLTQKLLEKGLYIPLPLRTERKGSDPLF